jgi:uncharacterized protein (TIGR02145 family)
MKISNQVLGVIFAVTMIISFGVSKSYSQVIDYDGNEYKTVKIGIQVWMAENLNVEHYRNGDPIPQVQDKEEWSKLTTGAWCYYDNDPPNGVTYGKLYDWYAVNDPRGLAPEGWHIPTDAEWTKLIDFLGGDKVAGGKLKATTLWQKPNTEASNSSDFTTLPGGFLSYRLDFIAIRQTCYFWSSTKANDNNDIRAWSRDLDYKKSDVIRNESFKSEGQSVRCIKD